MRMRQFPAVMIVVVLAALTGGHQVEAHAKLVRAEPAANSTLKTAPKAVRIWFTQELVPKRSTLSVLDARNRRVDDGKGGVDLADLDRKSMIARLKPLGPGKYTVRWRTVSAEDRDVIEGSFRFTVAP